jgi:hypothetical protein
MSRTRLILTGLAVLLGFMPTAVTNAAVNVHGTRALLAVSGDTDMDVTITYLPKGIIVDAASGLGPVPGCDPVDQATVLCPPAKRIAVTGSPGPDRIALVQDELRSPAPPATVAGNAGDDALLIDLEDAVGDGGPGNDTLASELVDYTKLLGGPGNDDITVQGYALGGSGDDTLHGYGLLDGGVGNDAITGDGRLVGGDGDDRLAFRFTWLSLWSELPPLTAYEKVSGDRYALCGTGDDRVAAWRWTWGGAGARASVLFAPIIAGSCEQVRAGARTATATRRDELWVTGPPTLTASSLRLPLRCDADTTCHGALRVRNLALAHPVIRVPAHTARIIRFAARRGQRTARALDASGRVNLAVEFGAGAFWRTRALH